MNQTELLNLQTVTDVKQAIRTAFNGVRHGSIEILIHDSKVIQSNTRKDSASLSIACGAPGETVMTILHCCRH